MIACKTEADSPRGSLNWKFDWHARCFSLPEPQWHKINLVIPPGTDGTAEISVQHTPGLILNVSDITAWRRLQRQTNARPRRKCIREQATTSTHNKPLYWAIRCCFHPHHTSCNLPLSLTNPKLQEDINNNTLHLWVHFPQHRRKL